MKKQFISCDWGTSSLRLRLVDVNEETIADEFREDFGVAKAFALWQESHLPEPERLSFYGDLLLSRMHRWQNAVEKLPLLISGMASSSIGMQELPYTSLPFSVTGVSPKHSCFQLTSNMISEVYLFSGIASANDVMRGEETLLLGCSLSEKNGVVVLPGTHSKHAFVENGVLYDFKTYMTGEFFDLLATRSLLAKSVAAPEKAEFDLAAFDRGVLAGANENLLHAAFGVRTNTLLKNIHLQSNYLYLSGVLIGSELKELVSANTPVHLVCGDSVARLYERAFSILFPHRKVTVQKADEAFVKGHCQLARTLFNNAI